MRLEWYVITEIAGRWVRSPCALSKREAENLSTLEGSGDCKAVHRSELSKYCLSDK